MSYVDVLIPGLAGAALIFFPQWFTKAQGEEFQKKRKTFRWLGAILLFIALVYLVIRVAQPSPAAGPEPMVEMHRTQATAADPSGWNLAASTLGGFSVLIPLPFNDFTVKAKDPKTDSTVVHAVGATSAEGIKFSATKMFDPEGKTPPDLASFPQSFSGSGYTVSDVDTSPFSGFPSVSFTVKGASGGGYVRYVKVPGSIIALTLEFPSDQEAVASGYREKFLSSLTITAPAESR